MTASRNTKIGLGIAGLLAVVLLIGAITARPIVESRLRGGIVTVLGDRFDSQVDLQAVHVSVFPQVTLTVDDVVLRKNGQPGLPPIAEIKELSAATNILSLLLYPHRINTVHIKELQLHVPPRRAEDKQPSKGEDPKANLIVGRLFCENATLEMLPMDPAKHARIFHIHRLAMDELTLDRGVAFHAQLDNPAPRGEIEARGHFGPWHPGEPSETPLDANFTFSNADLGTFKGIGGILSSTGKFSGLLNRINVEGATDVPDFRLTSAGNPMHLRAHYKALVDGTNGNTILEPVQAQLGDSKFVVSGGIVRQPEDKRKTITLDTKSEAGARIQDLLLLSVKQKPPLLTGRVVFQAKIKIPSEDRGVPERIMLDGSFNVVNAHFTKASIQEKIDSLSQHAQGKPDEVLEGDAVSDLRGNFAIRDGTIRFSPLSFQVEGALVSLAGSFGMISGDLDLHGTVRLQAKVSQTVTGFKSLLLKPFDGLFKKDGAGAVIPIKVTGTRDHPSIALELFGKKKS